jgi:hypothetical protein
MCIGWLMPEFEGNPVNYALAAVTFIPETRRNHKEPNQVSKLGQGAKPCF